MILTGFLAGCGKGAEVNGAPQPPPPTPSNATAYIGTQSPGIWTMSVDDTQNLFSYQAASASSTTSGALRNSNGVLDFGNQAGMSLGKAVEQPGVGALLRPGGIATLPVATVPQSDCLPITTNTRYIYTALPGPSFEDSGTAGATGYGTFVTSSSADGKSWSFTDVHNYVITEFPSSGGNVDAADTENGHDPQLFSATCTSTGSIGTVNADPKAAFPLNDASQAAIPNFHFNASGAFLEDRDTTQDGGWIGFVMPSSPVKPSAVAAAGTYRGFVSESIGANQNVTFDTEPVVFAQATDGTTNLAGATFANDDVTQLPTLNQYTITLGTQDATYNGVFPNARLVTLDPNGYCAQTAVNDSTVKSGFDVNGNVVCTALGVGIVSQVNGKYVLYFTSFDGTKAVAPRAFVIQFYLYQE